MIRELRTIIFFMGILIIVNATMLLVPLLVSIVYKTGEAQSFIITLSLGLAGGGMLAITSHGTSHYLARRGFYILIPLSYVVAAAYSSIPYMLGAPRLRFVDAFFEAMSGFSTTGATILTSLHTYPAGILLWRSLTEWIGGVGVLFLTVMIIPLLNIGGQQLIRLDRSEGLQKSLPRAIAFFVGTIVVYFVLTLACLSLYRVFGMTWFDAINHALTTVSTGGFSLHDASFGFFAFNGIEYVAIAFMIICSFPLPVLVLAFHNRWDLVFQDEQIRYFLVIFVVVTALMLLWVTLSQQGEIGVSHVLFNVTSILTGTGYASSDYGLWGGFAVLLFLVIMTFGGCSSSTTGGMKTFRLVIVFRQIGYYFRKIVSPRQVVRISFNGNELDLDFIRMVFIFVLTYLMVLLVIFALFLSQELDFITALSAAASAIGNVGPGLGEVVGPNGTYTFLPDLAKWIFSVGMLMGRIELLAVIVLLYRGFWRN